METILNVWTWIKTNWDSVSQIVGNIVAIATVIVGLTKSVNDDAFLGKVKRVLVYFSLLNEDGTAHKDL